MITVVFKPRPSNPNFNNSDDPMVFFTVNRNIRQKTNNQVWSPATDIYECEDKIVILVEIAGMSEEDFSISMDKNVLTIHGYRLFKVEQRRAIHQMEIPFGEFLVEIIFPMEVDIENVTATYENGFLQVTLPKISPKIIEINKE